MAPEVLVGGIGQDELIARIETCLLDCMPGVIGIASAFVSVAGVHRILSLLTQCGNPRCRLVAGIDHAVTHPAALHASRDAGWNVRLGSSSSGIFHPKLIVAGDRFDRQRGVSNASFACVGSANLTQAGLTRNVECAVVAREGELAESAARAFSAMWTRARPASEPALERYSACFAAHARERAPELLEALGIGDTRRVGSASPTALLSGNPPSTGAFKARHAEIAWVGLQSYTGEYTFQIEFPRLAGKVIESLVGSRTLGDDYVQVLCSDGMSRRMKFRFYAENAMFRLNVPNDVAGADWARQHRDGLAIVRRVSSGEAPIRLDILRPGVEANHMVARSFLLGTWGKTSTRLYGWL